MYTFYHSSLSLWFQENEHEILERDLQTCQARLGSASTEQQKAILQKRICEYKKVLARNDESMKKVRGRDLFVGCTFAETRRPNPKKVGRDEREGVKFGRKPHHALRNF